MLVVEVDQMPMEVVLEAVVLEDIVLMLDK